MGKSWDIKKVPLQCVLHSVGHPMDKHSSPDTLITSSVSGHSLFHVPLPKCIPPIWDSNHFLIHRMSGLTCSSLISRDIRQYSQNIVHPRLCDEESSPPTHSNKWEPI